MKIVSYRLLGSPYYVKKSGVKYRASSIPCPVTSVDVEGLSADIRHSIFEALTHPARVKILKLVQEKQLTFSALKREIGMESSGQLQHHMQKLSGFIDVERERGSYTLTDMGRRALAVYASSEASGRPLEVVCCLPVRSEITSAMHVGRAGTALRLSFAGILLALTAAYFAFGELSVRFGSSIFIGLGLSGAIFAGFFGISFLIAGIKGSPGCEVTAIPNLFARGRKYYCGCVITPFNLPDGRLLEPVKPSRSVGGKA
jgi:DNA-binding transcriptional ArsR family regulator